MPIGIVRRSGDFTSTVEAPIKTEGAKSGTFATTRLVSGISLWLMTPPKDLVSALNRAPIYCRVLSLVAAFKASRPVRGEGSNLPDPPRLPSGPRLQARSGQVRPGARRETRKVRGLKRHSPDLADLTFQCASASCARQARRPSQTPANTSGVSKPALSVASKSLQMRSSPFNGNSNRPTA